MFCFTLVWQGGPVRWAVARDHTRLCLLKLLWQATIERPYGFIQVSELQQWFTELGHQPVQPKWQHLFLDLEHEI